MSVIPSPVRDTRLDVFRALALITIYVNHVPGTVYENLTHKNAGFSDAAEAFVLISGIAAGFAYGTKFRPGNRILTIIKALRRAGVLYVAHIMTTFATLAIFSGGAIWFAKPDLMERINIGLFMDNPTKALLGLATLGHQLGYNNILSMYAGVLLLLPLFLVLLRSGLSAALAVSGAIWLGAGLFAVAPPNYPLGGIWFLNPLSWQFLFVIGLAAAIHIKRGGNIPFVPGLAIVAGLYVAVSFLWVRIPLWGIDVSMGLSAVLTGFDKTYLSLPRLLHVLAIGYLIAAIPQLSGLARTSHSHPLAILGRHSLPVFIGGTLLAMVAQVLKQAAPQSFLFDTLLIAAGIALQFALAFWLEWLRTLRSAPVAASVAASPTHMPVIRPAPAKLR